MNSIPVNKKDELFSKLSEANVAFQKLYPGDRPERQPVHTVYGGANLFKYNSAKLLGQRALESFKTYAPDFLSFGKVFKLIGIDQLDASASEENVRVEYEQLSSELKRKHPARLAYEVYTKVQRKLEQESI